MFFPKVTFLMRFQRTSPFFWTGPYPLYIIKSTSALSIKKALTYVCQQTINLANILTLIYQI